MQEPNCPPAFIPAACDVGFSLHERRHGWRDRTAGMLASSAALIAALIAIAGILSSSPSRQHTVVALSSLGEKYLLDYSQLNSIPCRADCGDEGAQNGQKDSMVKVQDGRSTSRTVSQGNMEKQYLLKNHSEHISLEQKEESAEADWYQRHLPSLAMDGANNYDIDCFYHHEVSQYC